MSWRAVVVTLWFVVGCRDGAARVVVADDAGDVAPKIEIVVECEPDGLEREPCAPAQTQSTLAGDSIELLAARFADLPGWSVDRQSEAVPAFLASCSKIDQLPEHAAVGAASYAGTASQWRTACAAARELQLGDDGAARAFFEQHFRVYGTQGRKGEHGKVTGYYAASLRGSLKRGGRYLFPLYARPDDLVSIQLSDFIADGRSRRVWGRVDRATGKVIPYGSRAEVRKRLSEKDVLLWIDDPVDAMGIEIQGSGRVQLDDGSEVWAGFAGKNRLRSGKNGTVMRAMRAFRAAKGERSWTDGDLPAYFEIADQKQAIVFFELQQRGGAVGTQDVVLTPGRSVAVDRAVIPLSAPIWLEASVPAAPGQAHVPWHRLVVAQDTGGAILGAVRVDVYFGADEPAHAIARRVNGPGRVWVLLPKTIEVR